MKKVLLQQWRAFRRGMGLTWQLKKIINVDICQLVYIINLPPAKISEMRHEAALCWAAQWVVYSLTHCTGMLQIVYPCPSVYGK